MKNSTRWNHPELRRDEERGEARKASWLELFFDLFFVVVIAQVAHDLAGGITLTTYLQYVVQFVPIFVLWVSFVYYCDRYESDALHHQLATFLVMLSVAGMAVFSHHGLTDNYPAFILSFAAGRLITTGLWVRATAGMRDTFSAVAPSIVTPALISFGCIIISVFLDGYLRYALLAAGLLVDLLGPLLKTKHIEKLPPISVDKTRERFGLFMIIVLGEMLVGVVAGLGARDHSSPYDLYRAAIALATGFALWWLYFNSVHHRLWKESPRGIVFWSYLHLPLFVSVSSLGPAMSEGLGNVERMLPLNLRVTLVVSLAVFLVSTGLIEMFSRTDAEGKAYRALLGPFLKLIAAIAVLLAAFTSAPAVVLFWYLIPVTLAPTICSNLFRRSAAHS